jgi:acyl carrier protein
MSCGDHEASAIVPHEKRSVPSGAAVTWRIMDDGKRIAEKVFTLVAQAAPGKIDHDAITPALSLRRDLGLDSLGLATLLFRLGEELDADPDELLELLSAEPINTVADMVALGVRLTARAGT